MMLYEIDTGEYEAGVEIGLDPRSDVRSCCRNVFADPRDQARFAKSTDQWSFLVGVEEGRKRRAAVIAQRMKIHQVIAQQTKIHQAIQDAARGEER